MSFDICNDFFQIVLGLLFRLEWKILSFSEINDFFRYMQTLITSLYSHKNSILQKFFSNVVTSELYSPNHYGLSFEGNYLFERFLAAGKIDILSADVRQGRRGNGSSSPCFFRLSFSLAIKAFSYNRNFYSFVNSFCTC